MASGGKVNRKKAERILFHLELINPCHLIEYIFSKEQHQSTARLLKLSHFYAMTWSKSLYVHIS